MMNRLGRSRSIRGLLRDGYSAREVAGEIAVTAAATVWFSDLSTVVFPGIIALLYWQPLDDGRLSNLVSRQ